MNIARLLSAPFPPVGAATLSCLQVIFRSHVGCQFRGTAALAVLLVAGGGMPPLQAEMIDAFDSGNQTVVVERKGKNSGWADSSAVLGGQRDIVISNASNGTTTADVNNVAAGMLSVSQTGDAAVSIFWDGGDSSGGIDYDGLGEVDLTAGGATGIEVFIAASDLAFDITLRCHAGNDPKGSAQTVTIESPVTTTAVYFPFAAFSDPAALSSAGALTLTFRGRTGLELAVDHVRTVAVPEPTSLAPAAVGLFGLLFLRRPSRLLPVQGERQ